MKTPDEIKKGLELHRGNLLCDSVCPYDGFNTETGSCVQRLMKDTAEYIQCLESRLAQAERERDTAVQTVHGLCHHCKNGRSEKCQKCLFWPSRVYFVSTETYVDHWEWRGVREENTKEEP